MKAYNVCVRPAGQMTHEVPKHGISAKEVLMLRHVHGRDGVIKIEDVGTIKDYDENEDLKQMAFTYKPKMVHRVFGVYVEDFTGQDIDPKDYITNFEVIEAEAKNASIADVLNEAGARGDAPQHVDSEAVSYVGDGDSAKVAEAIHKTLE